MMELLKIKTNHIFVGRAATAIYLVLKTEKVSIKNVLFPANICYAAVYPAIYAGYEPIFCDINPQNGNVDYDQVCKYIGKVGAAVIPHMYGNPTIDIEKIAKEFKKNGVLLIEDCASAMGADIDGVLCGTYGDYSIFSTGYSKTIDIGCGGILISNQSLEAELALYNSLPTAKKETYLNSSFFSKMYRLVRNYPDQTLEKYIWKNMPEALESSYIYKDESVSMKVADAIVKLPQIVQRRRENVKKYEKQLQSIDAIETYTWLKGAVPWRYNIFVEEKQRKSLIVFLLEKGIPVSDWYPPVNTMFGKENNCKNALDMGRRILNFPIMISDKEIMAICQSIKEYYEQNK